MRVMELHARAAAGGAGDEALEDAMDSAEPRAALRPRRGPGLRAGEAGVIPMRMESVEAMEFLSEQVHKRPRPPAPKMQLHLTAARRPSSPT